jgi:hypothetical protein
VLKAQLEQYKRQSLRNNLVMAGAILGVLAAAVAGVIGLIVLLGRLF